MINKQIFHSISVILPALNEQENIKRCVLNITRYLKRRFDDYEILVINGNSTDNTEKIVKKLAQNDKHIKLINRKKPGYGVGLRTGFARATKELIFYTDSDNQFDIKDMDLLLPMLNSYDIVSGYRIKRQDPIMRIFVGEVYNMLIRILFNLKIKDVDASFKLYKKAAFEKINLQANTGLIDAEVLIKARKAGFSIGQVGVTHYPRIKGRTAYEIGKRNNIIAIVRPKVVIDIIREIKSLWRELR